MLDELHPNFKASNGGGWSFLNACNRSDNMQWTGLHSTMEKLFMLGIAAGHVEWMPAQRDMWSAFPGGMPYVIVK